MAISPSEAAGRKAEIIPPEVIKVWDDLIAKAWDGTSSRITQDEAVMALVNKVSPLKPRQHVFDSGWLDIEPIYRAAGWSVKYDKPAYCENYDAYFVFSAK